MAIKGDVIDTIFGSFSVQSKRRLDLTYDYENAAINGFKRAAEMIEATRFFDVGSNIGVYAIFLTEVPSIAQIHAFEPSPETFSVLQKNVSLQKRPYAIETSKTALSDAKGKVQFAVFGATAGNNAIVSTIEHVSKKKNAQSFIDVTTAPLDDLIANTAETFMMKIDVEGHEIGVITGAKSYLQNNSGVLQIESFEGNAENVKEAMAEIGYDRLFRIKDDYYYTNLKDQKMRSGLQDMLFAEVSKDLFELQNHKRQRRQAVRDMRAAFDTIKFAKDPLYK